MNERIWFHGTTEFNAKLILEDGFNVDTYFARALEDALAFGGLWVFQVVLAVDSDNWQIKMGERVPSDNIVCLTKYEEKVVVNFDDRRRALFEKHMSV
jgi:hypothetical protein